VRAPVWALGTYEQDSARQTRSVSLSVSRASPTKPLHPSPYRKIPSWPPGSVTRPAGIWKNSIAARALRCKACYWRNQCTLRFSHSMATAGRSVEHRRAGARRHIAAGNNQPGSRLGGVQSQQADTMRPDWIAILVKQPLR
jgi:hypothetical protein